jgi:hypothetical protein
MDYKQLTLKQRYQISAFIKVGRPSPLSSAQPQVKCVRRAPKRINRNHHIKMYKNNYGVTGFYLITATALCSMLAARCAITRRTDAVKKRYALLKISAGMALTLCTLFHKD